MVIFLLYMSSLVDSSYPYGDSLSNEKMDITEEEDLYMVLMMPANKKSKHGGSVLVRAYGIGTDNERLMKNYFVKPPVYPERYFRRQLRMSTGVVPSHCQWCEGT